MLKIYFMKSFQIKKIKPKKETLPKAQVQQRISSQLTLALVPVSQTLYLSGLISMHVYGFWNSALRPRPARAVLSDNGLAIKAFDHGQKTPGHSEINDMKNCLFLKLICRASSNERLSLCWSRAASKYKASSRRSYREVGSLAVPGSQRRHGSS